MSLTSVSDKLLTPNKLTHQDLFTVLSQLKERVIDYADLYFQSRSYETLVLENSLIKEGSYHIDQGIGVRVISGEKTGFSYANQITLKALQQSAKAALSIIKENSKSNIPPFSEVTYSRRYQSIDPLVNCDYEKKIKLLHRVDEVARAVDTRVKEVTARLIGVCELILIAATDGTLAADVRPLIRLSVDVLVEDTNGKREHGSSGGGGRCDYNYFFESVNGENRTDTFAKEAVRIALVNLSAVSAPAGMMPVVLGNGWPGVLLHEAVGHGLEGDFNRRLSSVFSKKIGEKVTSELCSVVDDGTLCTKLDNNILFGYRGSLAIDDEGVPTQRNILIENGILKGYMQDKINARLMGMAVTGNARRESYAHLPMPRMTNTYMLAGQSVPEEIISSVKYGLYAKNFSGGQVDITSGKFVFSTSEAYLIKNGKKIQSVKGATLIGSGIEAMQQISMVGYDLEFDKGIGMCSKNGQNVPVGVGQPTLKLNNFIVGGTF